MQFKKDPRSIALSWFITTFLALLPSQILEDLHARCPHKVLGSVRLGVVGGDVMVEYHKQEDRHAEEVGEHRQLNVAYHYSEGRVDRDIHYHVESISVTNQIY